MKKSEIQILIVEDDKSLSASIIELIKKMGFKASAVAKVDEAINFVKIKPVHLAIVDCMLPKTNGIELVEQFRGSRFGENPVILMSGIFKDKSFATEAIKKTDATAFLNKPFDNKELKAAIDHAIGSLTANAEVTLNTLLTRHNSSAREQIKALGAIEDLKGNELTAVAAVLMSAEFSGHLNVVSSSNEIFGITFSKGEIVKFDGPDSKSVTETILLERQIISPEEMADFKAREAKGDILINLVEENFLSPHFIPELKSKQILKELSTLFTYDSVKINLVPDKVSDRGTEINLDDLVPLFEEVVSRTDSAYIENFYSPWLTLPIRRNPLYNKSHHAFKAKLVSDMPEVLDLIDGEEDFQKLLQIVGASKDQFLKILHFLFLTRIVYFDDFRLAQSLDEHGKRMKKIREDIEGKNAQEIFQYFGSTSAVKPQEILKIYKEFAKANHPDNLEPTASEEIREAVTRVFSLVSNAHDILTDPQRRDIFFNQLKQDEATKQMQSEGIAEDALNHLRKGRVGVALPKLREAYEMHSSVNNLVFLCWGELKAMGNRPNPVKIREVTKQLDSISVEDRRTAHYQIVQGLLKKAEGDLDGAYNHFDKALALDSASLDARREISALNGSKKGHKKGSAMDILTGDLSEITSTISSFFKKKAD